MYIYQTDKHRGTLARNLSYHYDLKLFVIKTSDKLSFSSSIHLAVSDQNDIELALDLSLSEWSASVPAPSVTYLLS